MIASTDVEAIKSDYYWMNISFVTFAIVLAAVSIADWSTQRDWPLYFLPFMLITYIWSAVAMRNLANSLGRRGSFWGWLAICFPGLGVLAGYVLVGRPTKMLIDQCR